MRMVRPVRRFEKLKAHVAHRHLPYLGNLSRHLSYS